MIVVESGHKYLLPHLESEGWEEITFIKRSSEMVNYDGQDHPGTNSQELIRVLIDRTQYLNEVGPCDETQDAVYHLRRALFCYEVRAFRRKQAQVNKTADVHDSSEAPNVHRDGYDDVPFTEYEIEELPTGPDGHIIVRKECPV